MKIHILFKEINGFILNTLFPVKCLGCGQKDETLCDKCISKIHIAERETDRNILAVFDYRDNVIKKAIWELKYHHKKYLGEKLGGLLYAFLIEDISELKTYAGGRPIYVIPVPISNQKTKIRGYNQSLSIARGFCTSSEKSIFEIKNKIVFKKANTIPQAKIQNKKDRLKNVKGVFNIKDGKTLKGRTVIIIDDVTTTGGTINEMMRVLKNAGVKRVVGFAVAH